MKVKTGSGFEFEIDLNQIADDWEILELVASVEGGDMARSAGDIVKLAKLVMGEAQYKDFMAYLKEKNGRISSQEVVQTITEIITASQPGKNS